MSQANVKVVQRIYEELLVENGWRDPHRWELVQELFAPDVEVYKWDAASAGPS